MLFDFLPFFLLICLHERCGCPSPALIPRCPISPCVRLSPLDFTSSLRRKRYWIRSSCSIGTLSVPCLFHCSNMFGIAIHSLSTISLRSGSFVPTSLGVISMSLSTSYMEVFCATPMFHLVAWTICVLIYCLFPRFFRFFLFLSSFFPFVGLVLPFCSIPIFRIASCWGFTWFLVFSVPMV
jgi:hypothetical protein